MQKASHFRLTKYLQSKNIFCIFYKLRFVLKRDKLGSGYSFAKPPRIYSPRDTSFEKLKQLAGNLASNLFWRHEMKRKIFFVFLFLTIPFFAHAAKEKYVVTNLVSDEAGEALIQDTNLVNPWGIAINPTGAFWVSDNETGVSTLYAGDVNGSPFETVPLVVTIPNGVPTGIVFNPTSDFVISDGTTSAPAFFIFVSESGTVSGWNPAVPPATEAHVGNTFADANFKGVALGSNATGNFLYLANFHAHKIDVLDTNFALVSLSGSFTDPDVPAEYSPFNIQNIDGKLYVMYALADEEGDEELPGPHRGFVSVFDTDGNLLQHLIEHGQLNAPWGIALAPADFGPFSNALLVGNFGNGRINAYDPNTGEFLGRLKTQPGGKLDGLWAITFGNGVTAGDANKLYFSAGPDDEEHGLFGSIAFQ